jgi:hypothetical protein
MLGTNFEYEFNSPSLIAALSNNLLMFWSSHIHESFIGLGMKYEYPVGSFIVLPDWYLSRFIIAHFILANEH